MELLKDIVRNLIEDGDQVISTSSVSDQMIELVKNKNLKILDLVQGLNPALTNASYQIRLKGVETLVRVVMSYGESCPLNEKEITVINEFLCLRLVDHKTIEKPVLDCMSYFVDLENRPKDYNKTLLEFLKTKINIRRMDSKNRHVIYQILNKIVVQKLKESPMIDSDMVYSFIHLVEGENDPYSLLLCFDIVTYILKNFRNLEPYIDDFFEWLTSYYPIDYTPDETDTVAGMKIVKADLVKALYDCFYSNELNADNLQTLLIEKLDSNLVSTKLESLRCLIKCYQVFPLKSIKDYASSLWTVVRMDCLKRKELVDFNLLQTSQQALNALATRLSEDEDIYFTFISDMYEELAIAFRKPEMELFEPAAQLVTNAISPKLKGFNYLLFKILPVALNAISSNELRPLAGLSYIFKQLMSKHPGSKLEAKLDESLDKLANIVCDHVRESSDSIRLLNSLVVYKVEFQEKTLNKMIDKLGAEISEKTMDMSQDIGETLALICIKYNRMDIIMVDDSKGDCSLISLIKLVNAYKSNMIESKFSIYLRLLIISLIGLSSEAIDSINPLDLNEFLCQLRNIALRLRENQKVVSNIARIHAIIIGKLTTDNLTTILMEVFRSEYCTSFIPKSENDKQLTLRVYFPVLKWILKSLVVRNHNMLEPVTNLFLNFVTSEEVDQELALEIGSRTFRFIHCEDDQILRYEKHLNFKIFSLYKQKFYNYTRREIQLRYEKENSKKVVLVCLVASQIPYLSYAVYRQDYEWLLRQILTSFNKLLNDEKCSSYTPFHLIFECLDVMVENDPTNDMLSLIESFIKANLTCAKEAKQPQVRSRALKCLAVMPIKYKSGETLNSRTEVLRSLKPCLSDKKRLVRLSAAQARLNWFLLGQPIGS